MTGDESVSAVRVTRSGRTMTRRVSGEDIGRFTADVVAATLDSKLDWCGDFALGFCAALDMFVNGTLDIGNPVGMVIAARRDVDDVSGSPRIVTDFMARACGDQAVAR